MRKSRAPAQGIKVPTKRQKHVEDCNVEEVARAGAAGKSTSEGQLVCWLASSMPLDRKIETAVAAMPLGGSSGEMDHATVSPRLACAVLQFSANALLRSTPTVAPTQGGAAQAANTLKREEPQRGFLSVALWALVESSLHTAPDQVASTVSGVGGHLVRPIHAALATVMGRCRAIVCEDGDSEAGDVSEHVSMARSVIAVLSLLRGPHAASFQPHMSVLCSMLSSLAADLTAVLDGLATQVSAAARRRKKVSGHDNRAEEIRLVVNRAAHIVIETISTVSLAARRAPNQRKIFSMAVDELIAPTTMLFAACSHMQQTVALAKSAGHSSSAKLAEAAADEGWKAYRILESLIGATLFSEEHLTDLPLAYSFRTIDKGGAQLSVQREETVVAGGAGSETGDGARKGKSKKMRGASGGAGYRGDKLKSYQAALFSKLLALAQGERPAQPAKGEGEKSGLGDSREGSATDKNGGGSMSKEQAASLHWFPELLRLFVVCARRSADPSVNLDEFELAFGEQDSRSLIGANTGGGSKVGGVGDAGGKVKKRKKEGESNVGVVAEMDFCRELLYLADAATGKHIAGQQASKHPDDKVLLLVRVYANILETVVHLDVYRAHIFSEAGEVKPFLRHLVDVLVSLGLSADCAEAGACGQSGSNGVVEALLQGVSHMLSIDHTAVEPHAQALSSLAMSTLRTSTPNSVAASAACGAAVGFLSSISRTMSRLNQGERFMEWFLAALRQHALPPIDAVRDASLLAFRSVCKKWSARVRTQVRVHARASLPLVWTGCICVVVCVCVSAKERCVLSCHWTHCNATASQLQLSCNAAATQLQRSCNANATQLQRNCNAAAAQQQRNCNAAATHRMCLCVCPRESCVHESERERVSASLDD